MEEKFKELAKPLVEFLRENYNPHTRIIIDYDSAEIVEGIKELSFKEPLVKEYKSEKSELFLTVQDLQKEKYHGHFYVKEYNEHDTFLALKPVVGKEGVYPEHFFYMNDGFIFLNNYLGVMYMSQVFLHPETKVIKV